MATNGSQSINGSEQLGSGKKCSVCPKWTPTSAEKFHDAENKMYKGKSFLFNPLSAECPGNLTWKFHLFKSLAPEEETQERHNPYF